MAGDNMTRMQKSVRTLAVWTSGGLTALAGETPFSLALSDWVDVCPLHGDRLTPAKLQGPHARIVAT